MMKKITVLHVHINDILQTSIQEKEVSLCWQQQWMVV